MLCCFLLDPFLLSLIVVKLSLLCSDVFDVDTGDQMVVLFAFKISCLYAILRFLLSA